MNGMRMSGTRARVIVVAAGLAGVSVLAAACGGGNPYGAPATSVPGGQSAAPPAASAPPSGAAANATLTTRAVALGTVLTDSAGRAVYLFEKDSGTTSACYDACAHAWPPLLTAGAPRGDAGVTASLLGTTKRTDGTVQVTYAGHPLYHFIMDTAPGLTKGEGVNAFGASWYVLMPDGKKIDNG